MSAVALQLIGRAVSEFSLPRVSHPALLFSRQQAHQLRRYISSAPYRQLYASVAQVAERAPSPESLWLDYARKMRAAAVLYALTGQSSRARQASEMLSRYPAPFVTLPRSCMQMSLVALHWAEAYDAAYEYLRSHRRLRRASIALARLAHRLYYTSRASTRNDRDPQAAWLLRAAALCACALALSDDSIPSEFASPQAWYAEGRGELRKWMDLRFFEDRLWRGLDQFLPVAVPLYVTTRAIQRAAGENPLAEVLPSLRRWLSVTWLGDDVFLDPATGAPVRMPGSFFGLGDTSDGSTKANTCSLPVCQIPLDCVYALTLRPSSESISQSRFATLLSSAAFRISSPDGTAIFCTRADLDVGKEHRGCLELRVRFAGLWPDAGPWSATVKLDASNSHELRASLSRWLEHIGLREQFVAYVCASVFQPPPSPVLANWNFDSGVWPGRVLLTALDGNTLLLSLLLPSDEPGLYVTATSRRAARLWLINAASGRKSLVHSCRPGSEIRAKVLPLCTTLLIAPPNTHCSVHFERRQASVSVSGSSSKWRWELALASVNTPQMLRLRTTDVQATASILAARYQPAEPLAGVLLIDGMALYRHNTRIWAGEGTSAAWWTPSKGITVACRP